MKKVLTRTAVYFTVITSVFSLVMLITFSSAEKEVGMSALRTFLFLPFSFLFSLANTILTDGKSDPIVRWLLHCVLTVSGGYICIILPSADANAAGAYKLMGFVILLIVYVIAAVIISVSLHRLRKTVEQDKELKNEGRIK